MSNQSEDWDKIFTSYKMSGLTQPAFCKEANISFHKFQYRWSQKLQANKSQAKIANQNESTEHLFEPVTISTSKAVTPQNGNITTVVVHLPNQIRCEIKLDSNTNEFTNLLKQLVNLC